MLTEIFLDAAHPDLFQPSVSALPPTTLTTGELLTIVSSCATSYPTTASRLTSLEDLPIPSAESSCALIALKPGLERLRLLQDVHEREVAELRLRSAAVLQRVYELGVLGGGECWTEWEGRMGDVEKGVRREEGNQDKEAKANEVYQS